MGIHLWRKRSYGKVEDHHPGCIWTVLHMLNYHPWHNVRKMLPYKKHKHPDDKLNRTIKELNLEEEHDIGRALLELKEDSDLKDSASVNSNSSKGGSKRSIKARIKALIKDKDNSAESDLLIQQPGNNLEGLESKSEYDTSAPTLMSLLKVNPKLIRRVSRVDQLSDITFTPRAHVKHKEEDDFVGVLELFNVDQELFLRILQDCPPRKPRLVKSGTFPSRNPSFEKTPSKIEHKHNEVWPTNNLRELRKAKSQGVVARSASFTESLERHGYLFDSTCNKAIKKHLSKSFRLANEKDYMLLNDLQGRRSFKERLHSPETESHSSFTMSETRAASLGKWTTKISGEAKGSGWRIDSPRDFERVTKLQLDHQMQDTGEELDSITITSNCETNDGLTSGSAIEVYSLEDEVEVVEWPLLEESTLVSNRSFSRKEEDTQEVEYFDEELQYIKYVLDIAGFTTGENQRELWHTENRPLDPALYDGIEVCCPFEPNSSNKDVTCMSSSDRKFLFDLINEALIDTHEKSYANFYPKALSHWCHVCPKIKGKNRAVEEVWDIVSGHLSWRPELDPFLDLAVADDLSRNKNGWVNLQLDTEDLALELENSIFNELLNEIVCY